MATDGGYEMDVIHKMNEEYKAWRALKCVLSKLLFGINSKEYEGVIIIQLA